MKILTSQNPKKDASAALAELLAKYQNVPVLFLSSGGSALSLLQPEMLPEEADITVSVLDEHYTADPKERNFEKLKDTTNYETDAKVRKLTFFDLYGGTAEEAGRRFDTFLRNWIGTNPKGKIVATVGVGLDGHTAGIVPFADAAVFKELFEDSRTLAVGYKTTYGPFPERVTSTFELLKKCDDVIIYAAGQEKAVVVQTLLTADKPVHEFPAMFLKKQEQGMLFTDVEL